jgi:prepilin-type N-terminal cleavage/methylation domain-containing protein
VGLRGLWQQEHGNSCAALVSSPELQRDLSNHYATPSPALTNKRTLFVVVASRPGRSFGKTMRGFSLIECVVALGITALLGLITLQTTHYASTIITHHCQQIMARSIATKTALIVSASLTALERTQVPGLVYVTDGSAPLTRFGAPHPLSGVSTTSRPRPDSAIVTSVEIDPRYRGRVTQSAFSGSSVDLEVCHASDIPSSSQFRSYLAFGLQGVCQFTGTPTRSVNGCFSFSGTGTKGIFTDGYCQPASLLEFAPVAREFSLFIDRTGELRLVSHVGMRILENQPIARGLRSMAVSEERTSGGALLFRLSVIPGSSSPLSFLLPAGLTRASIWSEVLL